MAETTTGVQVFVGPANQLVLGNVIEGSNASVVLEKIDESHQRIHFTIPSPTQAVVDAAEAAAADADASADAAVAAAASAAYAATAPTTELVQSTVDSKVPPAVTAALAASSTAQNAAAAAVAGKLTEAGVFAGATPSPDPTVAISFTDKQGRRFWLEAGLDGRPTAHAIAVLSEALGAPVAALARVDLGITPLADYYGWAWVLTDKNNRVLGGWRDTGVFAPTKIDLPADSVLTGDLEPALRQQISSGGTRPVAIPTAAGAISTSKTALGLWQLRADNSITGTSTVLHTAASIQEISLSADGATVFFTTADADGSNAKALYVATTGGTAERVIPFAGLAAFGDSMTHGMGGGYGVYAWPAVCAAQLGIPYFNGGLSAQMSTEIAIRQGGVSPSFNVTGGEIPAAGEVTLTNINPSTQYRGAWEWTWAGTIADVPGTLKKSTTDAWTFTRTTAGVAVSVPTGVRFISTPGQDYDDWIQTFWTGRNNVNLAVVTRDTASMVAHLKPWQKRYLVFAICNSSGEPIGSSGYNNVKAINDQLAATYGTRYVDVRRWLIDSGLAAAGITPTEQDLTDIALDLLPTSLRADSLHLNAAGYDALGKYIATVITSKGWV